MSDFALTLLVLLGFTSPGSPLLVAVWARLAPRPALDRVDFEPSVSLCLAVTNGAKYLDQKLRSIVELDYPKAKLEILIFSDGSTDRTMEIVRRYRALDPRIRLMHAPHRRGKPVALNRLVAEAHGEVLLMTDVRQRLAPNALRALVAPLADPRIGCVSGNLILSGESAAGAYWRYERFIRGSE